jgi:hypothetical protein
MESIPGQSVERLLVLIAFLETELCPDCSRVVSITLQWDVYRLPEYIVTK